MLKRIGLGMLLAVLIILAPLFWLSQSQSNVHAQSAEGPHGYKYISTATTTPVRNGIGYLSLVTINGGTAGAVTLYDISTDGCSGTPASGKFATIQAIAATNPTSMFYDLTLKSGLCVVTAAATDLTVVFN